METCCKTGGKIKARSTTAKRKSPLIFLGLLPIRFYRYFISPLLGPKCRFEPTCSHYAEQCIIRFGIIKGSRLSLVRLLKCHPWHEGGYDPIPEPPDNSSNSL